MVSENGDQSASSRASRAGQFLRHPVVIVPLLLFLFYEANAVGALGGRTRSTMHGRPLPVAVYRSETGLEVRFGADSYDPPPDDLRPVHGVILFQDILRKEGSWWPTRQTTSLKLLEHGDLSVAEQQLLLPSLAAAFGRQPGYADAYRRSADLVRTGVWSASTPLPVGIARNCMDAAAAVWLLIVGVLSSMAGARAARERKRAARGECPACGFNLAGLEGRPCPECGTTSAVAKGPE